MEILPKSIQEAVKELSKLPGVGHKTATRLVFYLLNRGQSELDGLANAIGKMKEGLVVCDVCCNIAEENPCVICSNGARNNAKILVVEDPLDVIAFENTHKFDGCYHVLHGVLSPIDSVGPDELRLAELFKRLDGFTDSHTNPEVIIATNPSLEGEATAQYIKDHIQNDAIKVSRIAKGLPVGGDLEYADSTTLTQSLEGRISY